MSRLLLVDNYDSFTFNLARYLRELGADVVVSANDALSPGEALDGRYDGVVISPGPGRPEDAGVTPRLVEACVGRVPLLGVCLGHQAIARAFGARIVRAAVPMHGKTSTILHDGTGLFAGLPRGFRATRYHSLVVAAHAFPRELQVNAWTADGTIMGLRHRRLPVHGVQFHPEAVLTEHGHDLLAGFLAAVRRRVETAA